MVTETPDLYYEVVRPYIDAFPASRTQWYDPGSRTYWLMVTTPMVTMPPSQGQRRVRGQVRSWQRPLPRLAIPYPPRYEMGPLWTDLITLPPRYRI